MDPNAAGGGQREDRFVVGEPVTGRPVCGGFGYDTCPGWLHPLNELAAQTVAATDDDDLYGWREPMIYELVPRPDVLAALRQPTPEGAGGGE
jgi:hypothetical protein